jgi:radical SAM superfamily enzyme YgiQ (UPF0313 family)
MRRAGFSHLNLALVSSDQTVRETTKRPHTIEKYLAVVNKAFELGFKITSYQILGLPSETLESMIQTLCFHARLPVLLGASPFYLTPNSPIARTMGILPSDKNAFRSRLTAMGIGRENANQEEVFTLFIATRILNFLKGLDFEDDEIMFSDILKRKSQNFREQIGLELLQTLFKNHILYANTPNGLKKQERFLPRLFFRLWRQLKFIQTQGRPIIRIDE